MAERGLATGALRVGAGLLQGAADEDAGEVLAVAGAGVVVGGRAGPLGGLGGGVAGGGPPASACSVAAARSGAGPMFTRPTERPCTATPTMAQSMPRLVNFWNPQPGAAGLGTRISVSSSSGPQRRLEQALEEVGRRDLALAGRPARDQGRVQREDHRRQVGRGVAVRERAADRAAVPDLRIADLAGGVGQQRQFAGQQRRRSPRRGGGSARRSRRSRPGPRCRTGRAPGRGRRAPRGWPGAASSAAAASARRPGTSRPRRARPPVPGPPRPIRPAGS